jgi:hypothetical protein
VVVLCEGVPNGFVQRVFEAGADDIIVLPDMQPSINGSLSKEVLFSLQKTVARRNSFIAGTGAGELICIVGPKGGIGKTLTCVNLGASLAAKGGKVVLVDLDLQFGRRRPRARAEAGEDDLRSGDLGRGNRCREGRGLPDGARLGRAGAAGTPPARPRRRDQRRVPG